MTRSRTNADNALADITGVTASTGLSGTAASGTATLSIDSTVATLTGSQTLTNKTLTSPIISTISNTGTLTLPTTTGTVALTSDITVTASSTTTLTNKTLTDPKIDLAINAQTGTTYTFVLNDDCKFVTASNASAQTYTIPPASSVAYNTGSQLNIIQKGAGQVTFAAGSGVTIRSTGATAAAPKLRAQYSSATAVYEGSDVWYVIGDIA
jgi:hypothetical protein